MRLARIDPDMRKYSAKFESARGESLSIKRGA